MTITSQVRKIVEDYIDSSVSSVSSVSLASSDSSSSSPVPFSSFGFAPLSRPLSMDLYEDWIDRGEFKDMTYLKQHQEAKRNPAVHFQARSAIVFTIPYWPHPWPDMGPDQGCDQGTHERRLEANPIALYARGKDYHREIPKQLAPLLRQLEASFPLEKFSLATDSTPLLERDLAYKAGLGWIGKNTCLIQKDKGSLFFIAEIITSLSLENDSPWSPDFCGRCNRCVEACPTDALSGDHHLSPERCISYWTIEAKDVPPESLRKAVGEWLFGCDICQTICPWNQKTLQQKVREMSSASTDKLRTDQMITDPTTTDPMTTESSRSKRIAELHWILSSSRKKLARSLSETPLARSAGWKLQRNALLIAAREKFHELRPQMERLIDDEKLGELSRWALKQLEAPSLEDLSPRKNL